MFFTLMSLAVLKLFFVSQSEQNLILMFSHDILLSSRFSDFENLLIEYSSSACYESALEAPVCLFSEIVFERSVVQVEMKRDREFKN